jgi:hypothetical protein
MNNRQEFKRISTLKAEQKQAEWQAQMGNPHFQAGQLLTLNEAREIISRNNSRPVSKSTIGVWARRGLLPVMRVGRNYIVDRHDAENFVITDHIRRKGNPGYPRPKCEYFSPGQGRCLKTARWVLALENAGTDTTIRCDECKENFMSNAETGKFRIVSVDRLPRQETKK